MHRYIQQSHLLRQISCQKPFFFTTSQTIKEYAHTEEEKGRRNRRIVRTQKTYNVAQSCSIPHENPSNLLSNSGGKKKSLPRKFTKYIYTKPEEYIKRMHNIYNTTTEVKVYNMFARLGVASVPPPPPAPPLPRARHHTRRRRNSKIQTSPSNTYIYISIRFAQIL